MGPSVSGRPSPLVRWCGPLLLAAIVVALDWAQGPGVNYAGTLVAVPLLAASLGGPWATAAAGALAVAASLGIGWAESQRVTYEQFGQVANTRQLIISVMTLVAVVASRHRTRSERVAGQVAAVADAAQLAILEPPPRTVGGLRCASTYRSATQLARIGGDLVAVVETPQGVRALVGDVQGKGLDAVRLAGYVLGSFRERVHDGLTLPELAEALDRTVHRVAPAQEVFVTAVLVQVEGSTGALEVLSCGHPAPLLARPGSSRAEELPVVPGPPLGLLDLAGTPGVHAGVLRPRERLVLLTDGLLEARRPRWLSRRASGPFLDAPALLGEHLSEGSLAVGLDAVVAGASRWARGRLRDDLALLVLERPAVVGAPVLRAPVSSAGLTRSPRPG